MKAVHFGAGNIGRGFVGLLLHEAGYEIVFADVNAELIDALAAATEYKVHEVGEVSGTRVVDNFRAINSATDVDRLVAEIATADIVTTAVGPRILKFVAPAIAAGLQLRDGDLAPLAVMACENAIGATDLLAEEVRSVLESSGVPSAGAKAVFANTAVDRIVPAQDPRAGIDVTVETFYEWVVESRPFGEKAPVIPGVTFVDDLGPYIERKLFTVNTGHATIAYLGFTQGATTIADAIAIESVRAGAEKALAETSTALISKHGLDPEMMRAYRAKILERFANPHLRDEVRRVGREPLRKLGRHERFIGPAAELAESGTTPAALLAAVAAVLRFDVPDDSQSVELQAMLQERSADELVADITGIESAHPLFTPLVETFRSVQAAE
ncbi:mannitol-1-phosphate 5-dehydrogenase [Diaminobutyricibacter tongyongensis]|uniref:Mannitol-1-phosphate 5-dehydrogenase n=1 Tax=Leifsonia tongyongensis TaxID=1268043 RepID=A0A6L9XVG6_9MICO|nr:mannitol-1-phosphate 5-dehydrogenase [Diaminobutyricibacter tongyongensis]NEN05373.1 mannitol-1-phosphate 5-dehydrogenase [Diaminobutyricibacter tongyongensis]